MSDRDASTAAHWAPPDTGAPAGAPWPPAAPGASRLPATARPAAAQPVTLPVHGWPQPGRPWQGGGPGWQPRPVYREPHPIRTGSVWAGIGTTALWFLMSGLLSWSLAGYLWLAGAAAVVALGAAATLARYGDRGVAVGVAATAGVGFAVPGGIVLVNALYGHWVLW